MWPGGESLDNKIMATLNQQSKSATGNHDVYGPVYEAWAGSFLGK